MSKRELPQVPLFGFVSLSSGAAALSSVVASGLFKSWFVLIAFVLHLVAFQIVFLAAWLLFKPVRPYTGAVGPWFVIPALSAGLGFALPFAIGLLTALFPIHGAIGGAVGGLAGAWVWLYAEKNPEALRTSTSINQRLSPAAIVVSVLGIAALLASLAAVVGVW